MTGRAGMRAALVVTAWVLALTSAQARTSPSAAAVPWPGAAEPVASGAAADVPGQQLVGDVAFSVPSGPFTGELLVSLSTDVPGAQIRYTTDGLFPVADSLLYTGPLRLTGTSQVRAQPFVDGMAAGSVSTALYVAPTVTTTHDLPVVVIDDYATGTPGQDFRDATVMTFEPGASGTVTLTGTPSLATRAGVRLHGQSSATFEKYSLRLELRDNQDEDDDLPFLGMPAEADWVLRGPFPDKSLVRDALTYSLGRAMGLRAPRSVLCEVYVNRDGGRLLPGDYLGVYLATETVKVGRDRLDLSKIKKSDLTTPAIQGGYVFKFDWSVVGGPEMKCLGPVEGCWNDLEVTHPDPLQPAQQLWFTQHVQRFQDVLNSEGFADPESGYAAWIDVDSFVDDILVNELSRNLDAYARSAYFHKDRYGKIVAGPLWDYDLAWGIGGLRDNRAIEGWQFQEQYRTMPANNWYVRLLEDPLFRDRLTARWRELRQGVLADEALDTRIRELTAPLASGARRNFERWPNLTTAKVYFETSTAATWQGQVEYLRTWAHQRAAWLDTQWRGDGWRP